MGTQNKRGSLIVEPTSQLHFPGAPSRPSRATLKLTNNTTSRIAFKIKTTAPSYYGVRPNTGIILPRNSAEVEIARQPFATEQTAKLNHKFMVQSFVVPEDVEEVSSLWSTIDPDKVGIIKLRCVFDEEPQPPMLELPKVSTPPLATSTPAAIATAKAQQMTQTSLLNAAPVQIKSPRTSQRESLERKSLQQNLASEPLTVAQDFATPRLGSLDAATQKPSTIVPRQHPSQSMESLRRMLNGGKKGVKPPTKQDADTQVASQAFLVNGKDNKRSSYQPQQWSYHTNDSTSVASKMLYSPKPSPVHLPPTLQQQPMTQLLNDAAIQQQQQQQQQQAASKQRDNRKPPQQQKQHRSDDIFTALQLASLNTEIHQLRTENKLLRSENHCLKTETQNRTHKDQQYQVRREYIVPHAQLPQQEVPVPICYVIASMTFALLCLIIGKFVL